MSSGVFRIPLRAGVYRITAELTGFTTVVRPGVELLVGRQAALNLELGVSGVQETVTVTGEAPLIDTTTSTSAATSIRGRCRSCRSTAATGWT